MGQQIVVSLKDAATGAYARPIFVSARGQAVRSFADELARPDSDLGRHPSDFELHALAVFEDTTGVFHQLPDGPEVLVRGRDLATPKE